MVETRKVVKALHDLGLRKTNHGHKHGSVYQRADKVIARPNTLNRQMTYAAMFQLGTELEGKHICTRKQFIAKVKGQVSLAASTVPDDEHVQAIRERTWDIDDLDVEENPVGAGTRKRVNASRQAGPAAIQSSEVTFEIVRISQFEVRVKGADGEIEVIGQFASKKDAVAGLTEHLMEQT